MQEESADVIRGSIRGSAARQAAIENLDAQQQASSKIQAGIRGSLERQNATRAQQEASAGRIQAGIQGKKQRAIVQNLAAQVAKDVALQEVGDSLLACSNLDNDLPVDKLKLQALLELLFSATDRCIPGDHVPPTKESILQHQAQLAQSLQEQVTAEMAEKLELEIELKETMAANWAMEQELGAAKQQIQELQEEMAQMNAELEVSREMSLEVQKSATKERELLEGENSYLAQQLVLAQQVSQKSGEKYGEKSGVSQSVSPSAPRSISPVSYASVSPTTPAEAVSMQSAAWNQSSVGSAKDLPFFTELTTQQQHKANLIINNLSRMGHAPPQMTNVCKALLVDQSAASMKHVWEVCDITKRNFLDIHTFKRALPMLGENVPDDEMDLLFEMADEDGSGKIVFSEFVMLCRALNLKEPYF